MDTTKLLEADHRSVESLFEKIDKAKGDARNPFIDELATSLRAHMDLEERVLYPAIEPIVGEESVVEANTEHDLARKILQDLINLAPDEPGFGAALESLKAGIEHHVKEEETDIFPKLRSKGKAVLDEIALPMVHTRVKLGLPTDAAALASASTKDDLLIDARDAGIEGTSAMSKDELADAVLASISE